MPALVKESVLCEAALRTCHSFDFVATCRILGLTSASYRDRGLIIYSFLLCVSLLTNSTTQIWDELWRVEEGQREVDQIRYLGYQR